MQAYGQRHTLSGIHTPSQTQAFRTVSKPIRPSGGSRLCRSQAKRQIRKDAMQERQRNKNEKLRVLRLISACVESNVSRDLLFRPL